MLWGQTVKVAHDDSKGRAIRWEPYSLEALSLPQVHLAEYWLQGFFMSTKSVKRWVAPLEHVVCPKEHAMQEKWKEASGNLGACSAFWRACRAREIDEASGTLGAPSASWRAGHVENDRGMNLEGLRINNVLSIFKTNSLINCHPVQNLRSKSKLR